MKKQKPGPKTDPASHVLPFSLKLSLEEATDLDAKALANNVTRAEYIRVAIASYKPKRKDFQ